VRQMRYRKICHSTSPFIAGILNVCDLSFYCCFGMFVLVLDYSWFRKMVEQLYKRSVKRRNMQMVNGEWD
jgi:hypothetical protein